MDANKIPIIGKIKKTMTTMMISFILLAIICLGLGIIIPLFPQVLDVLIGALLIVAGILLLNIAYSIHLSKKKYFDWIEKIK